MRSKGVFHEAEHVGESIGARCGARNATKTNPVTADTTKSLKKTTKIDGTHRHHETLWEQRMTLVYMALL